MAVLSRLPRLSDVYPTLVLLPPAQNRLGSSTHVRNGLLVFARTNCSFHPPSSPSPLVAVFVALAASAASSASHRREKHDRAPSFVLLPRAADSEGTIRVSRSENSSVLVGAPNEPEIRSQPGARTVDTGRN